MAIIEAEMQPAVAVQAAFDYGQIDEGIRDEVKAAARSIHQLERGIVTGMIAIGKRLIEVKGMLEHGQFTAWVEGEFGLAERTAQNWMNMARTYSDPEKAKKFSVFNPSVMYLLAAPSTPDEARAEVEQAAAAGHKVTVEFAKEAIRKAKPEPVTYAPIHQLEGKVKEWLALLHNAEPDQVLDALKTFPYSGIWTDKLRDALDVQWRKSDLIQAINNVRDQRRQAKLQASAKVVYVEPLKEVRTEAIEGGFDYQEPPSQTDDEGMEVHHMQWMGVLAPAPEPPTPDLSVPAPTGADLIVAQLIDPHTTTAGTGPLTFHGAIQAATAEQLEEAIRLMPDVLRKGRVPVLEVALRKLGGKPVLASLAAQEPEPTLSEADPRVASCQGMMDDYEALRRRINADFGRLTGKHTLIPPFERAGMALMVVLGIEIEAMGFGFSPPPSTDLPASVRGENPKLPDSLSGDKTKRGTP